MSLEVAHFFIRWSDPSLRIVKEPQGTLEQLEYRLRRIEYDLDFIQRALESPDRSVNLYLQSRVKELHLYGQTSAGTT